MDKATAYDALIDRLGVTEREPAPTELEQILQEAEAWTTKKGKNPKGGLNAAGRRSLKAQGQNIRPGVKNYSEASDRDKRRWISWATRFYSNPKGPMVDDKGEPTRLALMANAWGEPVPKTREAAQAIAAKARKRKEVLDNKKMSEAYDRTPDIDEGMLAGYLDEIGMLAEKGDVDSLAYYIAGIEWDPSWDESIDDMTYKGREDLPALLRSVMEVARAAGGKPTAEQLATVVRDDE